MSPRPSTLLGLVLCLGQAILTQEGPLPKPSLRAEPGPVIPRGRPVTFVCKSPVWAQLFRLEKDERFVHSDQESASHVGETEVRFHIPAVSEDTAGPYSCLYRQGFVWSELSEPLQLQVTEEDVSTPPSGLASKYVYILVGTSVAFLLCLLLLVLLLVYRQHRRKHESLHCQGKEQRPQERLSPAADIKESTPAPDKAPVYVLPEKKREQQSPSAAARDAQEVTYAQLDPRALALRAAPAGSPPPPAERTAAASTYAELPRR